MRGTKGGRSSARPASGAGYRAVRFRNREVPGDTEGILQRLPDQPSPELGEKPGILTPFMGADRVARVGAVVVSGAARWRLRDHCRGRSKGFVPLKGKGSLELVVCAELR